ncbi:MAG: ABC transporter permease [Gemmatimonadota bacterium]
MSRTKGIVARLRAMLGRRSAETRMEEEFRFHLEMETRKNVQRGYAADEARRRAAVTFGGVERYREAMRDGRGTRSLEEFWTDVRYAARSLRLNPTFSFVVLLTLALGIGANTAVFTLVDALLLRPLPVRDPEQLVVVGNPTRVNSVSTGSARTEFFSYPLFQDIRKQNRVLEDVFGSGRASRLDARITAAGDASAGSAVEHPVGRFVTGNYFSVLRVGAALGRVFGPVEDAVAGSSPAVVISHQYWQDRFAGDPGVLNRSITINDVRLTVVGVAAPGFSGEVVGQGTQVWLPVTLQPVLFPHRPWLEQRTVNWLVGMGRLKPGVTVEQAQAAIATIVYNVLDEQAGQAATGERPPVPVSQGMRGMSRLRSVYAESLTTLMIAVSLVLLIMCANVASLMLTRASVRAREMSVRVALGARRLRLVRQMLTESLFLSILGGALGLLVAMWGSRGLLRLASSGPGAIPLDARLDIRVLAYSALLALLAAVLFGLLPALRATRTDVSVTLRANSRSVTGGPLGSGRGWGIGKTLVAGQVALSMVLLMGTGLLLRTLSRLESTDAGLARERLLIVSVDVGPTGARGDQLVQVYHDLLEQIKRQPGVAAATMSENGIFSGTESTSTFQVEGFTATVHQDTTAFYDQVGPDYARTIGARLLQGRDIDRRDQNNSVPVVLINSTMARFYFGTDSPIGRSITVEGVRYAIIGVVGDVIYHDLRAKPVRRFYLPLSQSSELPQEIVFEIATAGDPADLAVPVRDAIVAANGSVSVLSHLPLDQLMRRSLSADRLLARIITLFGGVALILSALGLYGLMSYLTLRRLNEFGLRYALGAQRSELTGMILREAFVLIAAGAIAGLPLAFGGMQLIRNRLFGVSVLDPTTVAASLGMLATAVLLAAYIPAARAARVSPLVALRSD